MSYPVTANWIRIKKTSKDKYMIINLLYDEKYEADAYEAYFIYQLNGKRDPYKIDIGLSRDEIKELLYDLDAKEVIRDKKFLEKSFLNYLVTVWQPRITPLLRIVSLVINTLLLLSFLPLFVYSVYLFFTNGANIDGDFMFLGSILGAMSGIVLHEMGHLCACAGYGGRVFEVGVGTMTALPIAYVLMNEKHIKNRMKRVQIYAAGIEMNLFLAGLFLILSVRIEVLCAFFFGAAINNALLAFVNLMFVNGFDGMAIMGELLGVENLGDKAKRIFHSRYARKKLLQRGFPAGITVTVCYILRSFQVLYPVLVIVNIIEVILCF